MLLMVGLSSVGCAVETATDAPEAEATGEALSAENDAGDFSVALTMVDYNADGHVYKSGTVGTPLVSQTHANPAWSQWAQMPRAGEQVTGIRISLLPEQGTGILYKGADFQICIQGRIGAIIGAAQCTFWASQLGGSCPQTTEGTGCQGWGQSAPAKSDWNDNAPTQYRIGLNVRGWPLVSKRDLYSFAVGAIAVGRDVNANCNDPLFGCYRWATTQWAPATFDYGGTSHTAGLDDNMGSGVFMVGTAVALHTWYGDVP
jgi:hypothetical protein